jgi:predicted nuclease of predicted toxin-antitoxin system
VSEKLRLYLDEHVPGPVARGLRRRGVDVLTTQEADRTGSADREQLEFARQEGRMLVTFDSDFLSLAGGVQHSGIAYCRASKYSIGELIHLLLILSETLEAAEIQNHIEFL